MTCMNCGTQLPDNAAFCNVCGAKQNPVPVQQMNVVPQPMVEEDVKTMPLQPEMPMAAEVPVAAPMPVAAEQPVVQPEAPVAEQPETPAVEQPESPVAEQQPMAQPVMQEQPMQYQNPYANVQPMQYQNAQPMNNGMQYQNAQPMNNGMQYQNAQPMNNGMQYQNMQPMNGGAYPNQQAYNPYGYQNVKPAKNKKTGIIIGVILAAIIVVAVVLVLLLFKKDGHKSYRAAIDAFFEAMDDLETLKNNLNCERLKYIPGVISRKTWSELLKIGFIQTQDIPNYDVVANHELGGIIQKFNIA